MSGSISVTSSTISWKSDARPFLPEMFSLTVGTGSFAGENGQNGVSALNISSEPVGAMFVDNTPFITFDVAGGLPSLMLNFIKAGIDGTAGCTKSPAAAGQMCTPSNSGGSPFNFQNLSAHQSTASFIFSGVSSDGLSDWSATFTVPFNNMDYQQVLASLAASGSVTAAFSADVTVTPIPTPEPTPAFLLACGFGLLAVSFGAKRLVKN
jgi:hypothetical protein